MVSPEKLEIAAALLLTSPFVPMLFQGEEWAASTPFQYFTGVDDDAVGAAIREGRRAEFADAQARGTLDRSRLIWSERDEPAHARMLEWYRKLIELRDAHPDVRDGHTSMTTVQHPPGSDWLVVERGTLSLAVNLGESRAVPIRPGVELLLANGTPPCLRRDSGGDVVDLHKDHVAILHHVV